jgi:hypothetical protein
VKKTVLASMLALSSVMTDVSALDLMTAYEGALANDPTFRAAVKDAEAGRANLEIGRSGLLPQLSANYYSAINNSRIQGPITNAPGSPTTVTNRAYPSNNSYFQVTQSLFNLQALAQFRRALGLRRSPQTLIYLGLTYQKLGEPGLAIPYLDPASLLGTGVASIGGCGSLCHRRHPGVQRPGIHDAFGGTGG